MTAASSPILAALPLSLEYFSWGTAGLLFAGLGVVIVLLGVRSMAGLGPARQWTAIGVRLAVLLLMVLVLGGVRWQRQHKDLEVIFLRDVSQSAEQVPTPAEGQTVQQAMDRYFVDLSTRKDKPPADRVGLVSFRNNASIDAMPNTTLQLSAGAIREPGSGTDVAAAIQLALATAGKDAMHRFVLAWDGNATGGKLDEALNQAASLGVQVDVMPLRYEVRNEVLVDRFVAPTWKRENEPFTLDVVLKNTDARPVTGTLKVYHEGEPMDLDPYAAGEQTSRRVTLNPAPTPTVERVQVAPLRAAGVHRFRTTFEADAGPGGVADTLDENNAAEAFTFVRGKGQVLYVNNVPGDAGMLLSAALAREGIEVDPRNVITPDAFPTDLVKLQDYDAVVMANVPRGQGGLDEEQQRNLASYVHDMGGGLVMIGGPEAFGAGGWQGSKLEEVLPVDMDIPAQRQVGKGALVLVMHSCEFPNGNYWGEQCAIKAVETLSAKDEIGVITYGWNGGSNWDYGLAEKGDGSRVVAAIKGMQVGDMPSFEESMTVALNGKAGGKGLKDSDARQKHVIVISDGDPQAPSNALVQQYLAAKVTVSTVSVYPHMDDKDGLPPTMKDIAKTLKGKAYGPVNTNFNQLPQIFIKEATIVRRSLITEDAKGIQVKPAPNSSDLVKGLSGLPKVTGLVLTSKKTNPSVEMPFVAGAKGDPLLAHWQAGLGRAAVYTADAHDRWSASLVGSPQFGKFWAQVVRGVARPPMSVDFDVRTNVEDGRGQIVVEATNRDNAFLNFLNIRGTILGPDGQPKDVRLTQTAPGVYTADFPADAQGVYAVGLQYSGQGGTGGYLRGGLVVNDSPELRDLRSNEAMIQQVATVTGGRVLKPWDPADAGANVFTRDGLRQTASPMPVWDLLIPFLLGLILLDVAVRRIAWDWASMKRWAHAGAERVRGYTRTTAQVEPSGGALDALRRTRGDVAEQKFKTQEDGNGKPAPAAPRPDPSRKFEAKQAVDGDITQVVGGATDKPVPSGARKPATGDAAATGSLGSLMAAKRRAQQQIKKQEEGS
ncbi:MAG TPA: VWA domain-containing protein [Tepidisphaeraceae bacterium]|nr:VWA domain-containing protein [Tepidisphaeraceae bacterium]